MTLDPLVGSNIETKLENGVWTISIPARPRDAGAIAVILFMMCWLGGWAAGWRYGFDAIASGKGNGVFNYFWLGAWTVGGVYAGCVLFSMLRPTRPERLTLGLNGVAYDSGVSSPKITFNQKRNSWSEIFPKRIRTTFGKDELRSLSLRPTENGQRLTIDHAARRIDLGRQASEVELEWLFRALRTFYRLPPDETRAAL